MACFLLVGFSYLENVDYISFVLAYSWQIKLFPRPYKGYKCLCLMNSRQNLINFKFIVIIKYHFLTTFLALKFEKLLVI